MGVHYIILSFNKYLLCICMYKSSGKPIVCFRVVVSEFLYQICIKGYTNCLVTVWIINIYIYVCVCV